jgi:PAS domain S-box-containing protein
LARNARTQRKFEYPHEVQNRERLHLIPPESRVDDAHLAELNGAVRETEELFRWVANEAPVMVWMSGVDKLCNYFNQRWLQFTGKSLERELGNGWVEGVHPEDLGRCLETYTKSFDLREPFRMDYRLRRYDGEYRWILDSGVPIFHADGSFAGYIGSAFDVTESKLIEEALSKMSQRLIQAQERERTSIDEELQHCINGLVSLSIYLDYLQQHPPQLVAEVHQEFKEVRRELNEIVADIRGLSGRLQSSTLEYLGIAAAAANLCKELSDLENVRITFDSAGVPNELPKEISHCLYHLLKEALDSAIKYSASRAFEVSLRREPGEIQLTVSDWGGGFDAASVSKRHALTIAMKQRLQLVGGDLIESKSERGTTIRARVPWKGQPNSRVTN